MKRSRWMTWGVFSRSVVGALAWTLAITVAAQAQGRGDRLKANEFLGTNEYLVSNNRAFFAIMQGDGNLVVYKGSGPADNMGFLWGIGAHAGSKFFAIQQSDGNFVVYKGSGPADNQGWQWGTQKTAGGGKFILVVQGDGNLCSYSGDQPSDGGRLWCSMVTGLPITWLPDGKQILSEGQFTKSDPVYYGQWQDGDQFKNTLGTWIKHGKFQRWVFVADGTLRQATDSSKCLRAFAINGIVATLACDGSEETKGWSYRASDRTIRKAGYPKGCLKTTVDGAGWRKPTFDQQSCLADQTPPSPYRNEAIWRFE
jgi:hypothetical protein